ncbi:MAG: hypothetical protein WC505_05645 [Patescibacteria group bacterium]
MSADNGIIILRTIGTPKYKPSGDPNYEWRVHECQNLEEFDYVPAGHFEKPDKRFWNLPYVWSYFSKEKVFNTAEEASEYARTLLDATCVCEYGICVYEMDEAFPTRHQVMRFQFETLSNTLQDLGNPTDDLPRVLREFAWELRHFLALGLDEDQ